MPPRSRGRPRKIQNAPDESAQTGESSETMAGGKSAKGAKRKGKARATAQNDVANIYQDMLAEALPVQSDIPERPLKRRRTGRKGRVAASSSVNKPSDISSDADEDIEFEDVLGPETSGKIASGSDFEPLSKQQQTAYRDSDEESEDDDIDRETLKFESKPHDEPTGDLELTLTRSNPQRLTVTPRRKVVTKVEKNLRLQVHKMHILCLLSHVDRRNEWCNDLDVQHSLKPLLDKKMLTFLRPKSELSQFARADSLKRGLEQVSMMWRKKFRITTRGMRRSLWADDEQDIQNFKLPIDAEASIEKSDFKAAAQDLKGSRDLGTQLYCALLRSTGLNVRLVCSLQPLSFNLGGPAMPKVRLPAKPTPPEISDEGESVDIHGPELPFISNAEPDAPTLSFTARRLGHPNAADYHMPEIRTPALPKPKAKEIRESPYPIYWIEVLDEAHQKWFPVDPLVTATVAKPSRFEPPVADRDNNMSYVIAFEDEGSARDVTRRYTKAYNSKTRKIRVESTDGGQKWLRRTMRAYSRGWKTDTEQIEDNELAAIEAREPMPKNVADFKDHPYYALERHLRRNEVLTSSHEVGKVAAGRDPGAPGGKKLEGVFRRRDVKTVKSADAWYRLGREVKMGEQPLKTVAAKQRSEEVDVGDDLEERAGTNLYAEDQTELYQAPPIVNGQVPKNSYGNLDIYVQSMIPKGGVHISDPEASRAARLLGIDYAEALTGFEFKGRHGTAILKGVIVAVEYREAVEATIQAIRDEQVRVEEGIRTLAALKMWKRFLIGLRIKERIDTYAVEGEGFPVSDDDSDGEADDGAGRESEEYFDDGAGGFFPE
ncbi:hypothetical protein B7494_g4171 [Chlorociboria aeruginascens]|nr:hypothetical protein B7494_g4171 [Chlorociboria aeruginascens]